MALTRNCAGPSSTARARVSITTPPLLAAYATVPVEADLPRDRGEVDDAAAAPADHAPADDLAGEEHAGQVDGDDAHAIRPRGSRPPGSGA